MDTTCRAIEPTASSPPGEFGALLRRRLQQIAPDAVLTRTWDSFYQTYTRVLRIMAAGFGLDAPTTDEFVQTVWLQVVAHLPQLEWNENRSGLRTWFHALVRHSAVEFLRQKHRYPAPTPAAGAAGEPAQQEDAWEARWRQELVQVLLRDLQQRTSPLNYRLISMRWLHHKPLSEVAQKLHLSERQVTYRQEGLFRKLRASLAFFQGDHFAKA